MVGADSATPIYLARSGVGTVSTNLDVLLLGHRSHHDPVHRLDHHRILDHHHGLVRRLDHAGLMRMGRGLPRGPPTGRRWRRPSFLDRFGCVELTHWLLVLDRGNRLLCFKSMCVDGSSISSPVLIYLPVDGQHCTKSPSWNGIVSHCLY